MSSDSTPSKAISNEQPKQQQATVTPSANPQQDFESSFLSQSQDHDTSLCSSVGEGEKHPKARRKRTTAKDKMILEEAYCKNPKPDKQARLEIVDRVSLNEKEVQIWFQNRRQNDRRKSRPLSPQEIAALRYNGSQAIADLNPQGILTSAPEAIAAAAAAFSVSDPTHAVPPLAAAPPSSSPQVMSGGPKFPSSVLETPSAPASTRLHPEATPPQSQNPDSSFASQESHAHSQHQASQSFSGSVGYLANRWNIGHSFPTSTPSSRDESPRNDYTPSTCSSTNSQSAKSHIRLSLSLEGKAELVSNDTSPSRNAPPRPSSTIPPTLPQPRPRSLQRSQSALPSITLPPISALTSNLPPPLLRGRSRDVHAWESCADADTHDELTEQAEHESTGSAIAAISLLRSSSGVLQPSGTKRNASLSRSTQRPPQAKKAKLGRSSTSMARLENIVTESAGKLDHKVDSGKVKVSMLVSPTDSDKENWSPDEDGNPDGRRRPLPSGAPPIKSATARRLGRILQGTKGPSLLNGAGDHILSTGLGNSSRRNRGAVEIFEDSGSPKRAREEDVEKFMRGDVSPSKKGDMDCVAGLLSLSQGAWR